MQDNGSSQASSQNNASAAPRVRFSTANLRSSYANVCSLNMSREEVVMNFGINQSWEKGSPDVQIDLTNRIIMSPLVAARMLQSLQALIDDYQKRYGQLENDPPTKI